MVGLDRNICVITQSTGDTVTFNGNANIHNLTIINTNSSYLIRCIKLNTSGLNIYNCIITKDDGEYAIEGTFNAYDSVLQSTNVTPSSAVAAVIYKFVGTLRNCYISIARSSGALSVHALYDIRGTVVIQNCHLKVTDGIVNAQSGVVQNNNGTVFIINSFLEANTAIYSLNNSSGTCYWAQSSSARAINGTVVFLDDAQYIKNTAAGNIAATTVQSAINELDDEKADIAGDDTITGLWRFDSLVLTPKAIADSPASPQEGHFWMESTAVDSGPNIYHGGKWKRLLTDADHNGGLTYISTSGTVTVDTGLEYQKVSGGTIAYTADHLHNFTHSAGTLTYIGTRTLHFTLTAHASLESGETAQEVSIRLAKNGSTIAGTDMETTFTAQNAHQSSSTKWLDELSTNDYIEVFATSDQSADEVIFNNMILIITEH